jgi:hypothetical protein
MKKYLYILFVFIYCRFYCAAQTDSPDIHPGDTLKVRPQLLFLYPLPLLLEQPLYSPPTRLQVDDSAKLQKYSYHWIFYYDFFTTLTAIHHINSLNPNDVNNLYYYYNIDLKSNFEFRKIKWDMYLFNDYGARHFFDSITAKTQDQLTFKNSFYYPLLKNKLYFSVSANTQTQLFNSHQYRTDDKGLRQRYLYDGYMSPGIIIYAGGLTFEPGGNSVLTLGLGSSKVTKVKNQKIFETRNEDTISGVEKGKVKKSEIGLSLTSTVPLQHAGKHLHWEFYGNVFAPLQKLKSISAYTIDVNNVFHISLLKYVRLSLRTKLEFNAEQNPKPRIQNHVSLGFYLSNHLR